MKKCIFFILIFAFFVILSITSYAAQTDVWFTVDGKISEELCSGEVFAYIQTDIETSEPTYVCTAIYSGGRLTGIDVKNLTLLPGACHVSDGLEASGASTSAKVMILKKSSLSPLCKPFEITNTKKPSIASATVSIAGKSYQGSIDTISKKISFDVMTTVNKDGTMTDYTSTATLEEFDSAVTALSPEFVCSGGAYVENSGKVFDFSSPVIYSLVMPDGTKEEYEVTIGRTYGLRKINFFSDGVYLVTPATAYGSDSTRHGAPGAAGTVFGGGQWRLNNFEFQKSGTEYITESGSYVRTEDSPGYLEVNPRDSVAFVKDKTTGSFGLYSSGGGSTGLVDKINSSFTFSVDSLSGTGFDIAFGDIDCVMRIAPFKDDVFAVYFGEKSKIGKPVMLIREGTKHTARVLWKKTSDGKTFSGLYIDGSICASVESKYTGAVDLNSKHVMFDASADTLCSIKMYSWEVSYAPRPVSKKILSGLDELNKQFDYTLLWLANMYDSETGGFYMAMSGKEDPQMAPAIEMTGWGISILKNHTDLWDTMPEAVHNKFVSFFTSRQDAETGYFIDTQGIPESTREISRNQSAARSALSSLGATALYPHPYDSQAAGVASLMESTEPATASDSVIPDYMESVETYIEWIESWNWDTASWTAGDQLENTVEYVKIMDSKHQQNTSTSETPYQDALFAWLSERQSSQTGFWSANVDFNGVSGVYKVGRVYSAFNKKMNYPEQIINSIIEAYRTDTQSSPYFIRNPISAFMQISGYGVKYKEMIHDVIEDNISLIVSASERFLCPDGAFSASYQKSMLSFGGVTGSHQLYEGDIDATMMIYVARRDLYSLFGLTAPKFSCDRFWDMITGNAEMPLSYADMDFVEACDNYCVDFEAFECDTVLGGSEFGGESISESLSAKIVNSGNALRGKSLCLSYDGSLATGSGPEFHIEPVYPFIRYNPETATTISFDIYIKSASTTNGTKHNLIINYGSPVVYALSLGGNSQPKLTHRISTTSVSGDIGTLSPEAWHNIRLVYDNTKENCADIYIDDVKMSEDNLFWESNRTDATPKAFSRALTFVFYRASDAEFIIDNVKIEKS